MAYLLAHLIRACANSFPLFVLAIVIQNIGYPGFLPHNTYLVALAASLAFEVGCWRVGISPIAK